MTSKRLALVPASPIRYGQSQGEPAFLDAVLSYYHGLGFSFLKTQNLQATSGGSEAIAMAMFAVADSGEEILTLWPGSCASRRGGSRRASWIRRWQQN